MKTFADYYAAGNIPEDVINALYDTSVIDRPFTGRMAHIGASSAIKEFLTKELRAPSTTNHIIDGADAAADDTSQAVRRAQPMQLQEAGIRMGDQAMDSDSFGNIAKFETQLEDRTNELYRDLEARSLSEKASVIPVTNTVAGQQAGFFAQVATATDYGATGSDGGWNAGTGVFDAPTPGTTRALAEAQILGVLETMSRNGANPDNMQFIPELKGKFSQFMMTSSSRVGVLVTQAPGGAGGATAVQSVMTYETDYGVLEVINNRIMQPEVATASNERANVAIVQTNMVECADQWTPRAKRLGPQGAGEKWQVTNSGGICVLNEKAHGAVRDINYTLAMTA